MKSLTVKQRRFVDAYIETGNAAEAARRAGYKSRNADVMGRENLRKPTVRKVLEARLKELEDAQIADAREVLIHLTSAMRGEIEEEIPVVEGCGKGVSKARIIRKHISARDRLRAAEMLMKRHGLLLSDIEREEKQARTDALKKESQQDETSEGVVIAGEGELLE
uniref:Terminase small subunit n=1 Tax=Siphoviridae sp. ctoRD1 TaxID=2825669 RepID=A0A8S5QEG9_9CAUD|nr:MAG TPA: Terminase small subunit [Siphoviridae sp. ctoRD1]